MKKTLFAAMALVILLAGTSTGQIVSGNDFQLGREYSFESFNYPGEYIRHQNSLGEKSKIVSELDRKDASFRMVKGLAGTCVSFESVNYPGRYLRHQNSRIKLDQPDGGELFNKDATFCRRGGLAYSPAWSFESLNYPGFFLTHNNGHLFIERRQDALFAQDATFKVWPALYQDEAAQRAREEQRRREEEARRRQQAAVVDCRGYDVSFTNSAGFVASLTLFYGGKKAESGSLAVGQQSNFHLDCNVGTIRILMQYNTGFGWKTLYDQTMAPSNYCFKATGTLFNPGGGPCQ